MYRVYPSKRDTLIFKLNLIIFEKSVFSLENVAFPCKNTVKLSENRYLDLMGKHCITQRVGGITQRMY